MQLMKPTSDPHFGKVKSHLSSQKNNVLKSIEYYSISLYFLGWKWAISSEAQSTTLQICSEAWASQGKVAWSATSVAPPFNMQQKQMEAVPNKT